MTTLSKSALKRTLEILEVPGVIEYVFGPDAYLRGDVIILVGQPSFSDYVTGSIWEQVSAASFWDYYVSRADREIRRMLNESAGDSVRCPRT